MAEQQYPVLVTGTMKYIVWVDAADAADAHEAISDCASEWVGDENPVDAWLDVEPDPEETARFIWLYGSQFMPQHDAHVHTHRWAIMQAAEAGER